MPGSRDHIDQPARDVARSRTPETSPVRADRPAITTAADPRLTDASSGTQADLMHVQRTAGNAAVAKLVAPAVQRVVSIDEVTTDVATAPEPADGGDPTAASPADGSAAPEADHTINAAHIGLNAPMVEAPGVIRAQTVIADSIVATSYSPGAGNLW